MVGKMGFALVTGVRGFDLPEVAENLAQYRDAWQHAGHPGEGDVYLRIPIYEFIRPWPQLSRPWSMWSRRRFI